MPRVFIGIDLPDSVDRALELMAGGIPGARWEPAEKLHVTLRFLGDLDKPTVKRVADALDDVDHPWFALGLRGVGVFPLRGPPRILWAGIDDPEPVSSLRRAIDRALSPLGLETEHRKYHPHATLARLKRAPERRVAEYIIEHALFSTPTFPVTAFQLYSSVLAPRGSKYTIEAEFGLDPVMGSP